MTYAPIVTPMNVEQQGAENFPVVAGWVDAMHLAANTAASYTIATLITNAALKGKNVFLVFSADGPFWANFHGTAAVPGGNVTNGTASEFSPAQRYVDQTVTAISFIATAPTNISIQVYEV